jgi:DNA-binding NtrC family response regulator
MKAKILVVDDEPHIRELFHDALSRRGYEVSTTDSGEEALALARTHDFNIIFLDIKMPGMNGVETLKGLQGLHPRAVYVMITGFASSELVEESLGNGALMCLSKPFGIREIDDIVTSILEDLRECAPAA